jgi:hypothetical protein
MRTKNTVNKKGKFAYYKDGEKIVEGTIPEIAKALGKSKEEVFHYQAPAYIYGDKRHKMLRIR